MMDIHHISHLQRLRVEVGHAMSDLRALLNHSAPPNPRQPAQPAAARPTGEPFQTPVASQVETYAEMDRQFPNVDQPPIWPNGSIPAQTALTVAPQIRIRMGFGVDVVGYSRRTAPAQIAVQERVAWVMNEVLLDIGLSIRNTDRQEAGDGMHVFFPPEIELHQTLPRLIRGTVEYLASNNKQFEDRIRLRMATVIGPVGHAALGFGGRTVIACGRLLDSDVLRDAVLKHPSSDLVVLVSDLLYRYVVGEGYPGLDPDQFQRKRVRVKEFDEVAWLWAAPTTATTSYAGQSG